MALFEQSENMRMMLSEYEFQISFYAFVLHYFTARRLSETRKLKRLGETSDDHIARVAT